MKGMSEKKMRDQELNWRAESAARDAFMASDEGKRAVKTAKNILRDSEKQIKTAIKGNKKPAVKPAKNKRPKSARNGPFDVNWG